MKKRTAFRETGVLLCLAATFAMGPVHAAADEATAGDQPTQTLNTYAAEAWKRCRSAMSDILALQREKQELPRSALLKRDQRDASEEIDDLLDEVLEKLRLSAVTDYRRAHTDLEERIVKLKRDARQLREERITADEKKSFLRVFKLTKDGYSKRIEKAEAEIKELEKQKEALVAELAAEYERMGLDLSADQVRFYLSSVSGRDIMALSAVFDNVRSLNGQLETLMKENRGDPEAARRYYGIHVVMIRTVVRAHEVTLENIEERYLKRIDELGAENAAVRKRTDSLLRNATSEQRAILESNRQAQDATDEALTLYREHLQSVEKRLDKALTGLRGRHDIARNAYDTISISSALADEMQAAIEDLATLSRLHLPELVPFDNEAIQQKFGEITAALEAK